MVVASILVSALYGAVIALIEIKLVYYVPFAFSLFCQVFLARPRPASSAWSFRSAKKATRLSSRSEPANRLATIFPMNPLLRVVLEVVGAAARLGLFSYYLYRAVLETRKRQAEAASARRS